MSFEYKVVPAPTRGLKARGVKTAEHRFANALQATINEHASSGWEYIRADTLPCEQREGLMSKTTVYQNMLVFRRNKAEEPRVQQPPVIAAPEVPRPVETPPLTAPKEDANTDEQPEVDKKAGA